MEKADLLKNKYIFIDTTEQDLRHGKFEYHGPYDSIDECKGKAFKYLMKSVMNFEKINQTFVEESIFTWEISHYYTGPINDRIQRILLVGTVKLAANTAELAKLEVDSKLKKRWKCA